MPPAARDPRIDPGRSLLLSAGAVELRADPRPQPAPGGRPRRRGPVPWIRLSLACAAAVGGLSALAARRLPAEPPPGLAEIMPAERAAPALLAPAPAWTELDGAPPHYALDAEGLAGLPLANEARRHRSGGREDGIVAGDPAGDGPHLRLTVSRLPREVTGAPASLFVEVARRAAEVELAAVRVGQPAPLATKLGTAEAAELGLEAGRPRACLAVRLQHGEGDLRLFGWYCGPGGRAPSREALACLVDGLVLAPGADDPALRVLFAQAERQRAAACRPRLASPETRPGLRAEPEARPDTRPEVRTGPRRRAERPEAGGGRRDL